MSKIHFIPSNKAIFFLSRANSLSQLSIMILMMMQALGELAVMYPVNGAFYTYIVRFVDPSWGFALGWEYTIQWLTILPFELTAAGLTIKFWNDTINVGVWIAIFLVALTAIQFFGVRGYVGCSLADINSFAKLIYVI